MPTYGASKAGVHAYTESLRAQLAGTGVEVTELIPPAVATAGQENLNPAALNLEAFLDEVTALMSQTPTPARSWSRQPNDSAGPNATAPTQTSWSNAPNPSPPSPDAEAPATDIEQGGWWRFREHCGLASLRHGTPRSPTAQDREQPTVMPQSTNPSRRAGGTADDLTPASRRGSFTSTWSRGWCGGDGLFARGAGLIGCFGDGTGPARSVELYGVFWVAVC